MYDKINILLPTRGRAAGLLKLHLDSSIIMCAKPENLAYTFLVDADDVETISLVRLFSAAFDTQIIIQDPGRPHLAMFYNRLFGETQFKKPGTIIGMVGDDMRWDTKRYDEKILGVFNSLPGPVIACCDDGLNHSHRRFVNMFLPRYVVDATEKQFMCPSFPADYTDDMWWKISEGIGATVWLDDIVLYHDHASRRRVQADRDETCRRLRETVSESRSNLNKMQPWIDACVANLKRNGVTA